MARAALDVALTLVAVARTGAFVAVVTAWSTFIARSVVTAVKRTGRSVITVIAAVRCGAGAGFTWRSVATGIAWSVTTWSVITVVAHKWLALERTFATRFAPVIVTIVPWFGIPIKGLALFAVEWPGGAFIAIAPIKGLALKWSCRTLVPIRRTWGIVAVEWLAFKRTGRAFITVKGLTFFAVERTWFTWGIPIK